mgnify:FL=1
MSAKKGSGNVQKYFSEESSGMRIQPKTVLLVSLIYIGIVVLLHIWAKVTAPAPVIDSTDIPEKPKATTAKQPTEDTDGADIL